MCSDQVRRPWNSPEFKELHGQNQNTYGPQPHHCATSHFAPVSEHSIKRVHDSRNSRGGGHVATDSVHSGFVAQAGHERGGVPQAPAPIAQVQPPVGVTRFRVAFTSPGTYIPLQMRLSRPIRHEW
jgi:hypothetical protein